jgi:FkbM family methyltransferase
MLADHFRRVLKSVAGFQVFGFNWFLPWVAFVGSPLLSRLVKNQTWKLNLFSFRPDAGDLYAFANVFEDYPLKRIRSALPCVEQVVDAGANVGAFSRLIVTLAREQNLPMRIVAVEPADDNVSVLKKQPFADSIEIIAGAIGPSDGVSSLRRGMNSVTHSVDFNEPVEGLETTAVYSLQSLCHRRTLLKMDIEGGEYLILKNGLPDTVKFLFMEWHPSAIDDRPTDPTSLLKTGTWHCIAHDLYGSSMWFWELSSKENQKS